MTSTPDAPSADELVLHRRGRVEIYDTDASGLIFYGAAIRWFCDGETELWEHLGLAEAIGQVASFAQTGMMTPTRSVELGIEAPLAFLDHFDHFAWISAVGRTSYAISHLVAKDGQPRVRGTVRRVRVALDDAGTMVPTPVPEVLAAHVAPVPPG